MSNGIGNEYVGNIIQIWHMLPQIELFCLDCKTWTSRIIHNRRSTSLWSTSIIHFPWKIWKYLPTTPIPKRKNYSGSALWPYYRCNINGEQKLLTALQLMRLWDWHAKVTILIALYARSASLLPFAIHASPKPDSKRSADTPFIVHALQFHL